MSITPVYEQVIANSLKNDIKSTTKRLLNNVQLPKANTLPVLYDKPSPMVKNSLPGYTSKSIVPTLAKYNLPAFVAYLGLDSAIARTKQAYYDKMKENGIGRFAPTKEDHSKSITSLPSAENFHPTDLGYLSPNSLEFNPTDTLISVLKSSSNNTANISSSILESNNNIVNSINSLTEQISLSSEINMAYRDATLENDINANEYLNAVSISLNTLNTQLSSNSEIDVAYKESSIVHNESVLVELKNVVKHLENIPTSLNSGLTVRKSSSEIALTSKQLEHLTYETTPIKLDNLGDTIPKATPQQMRAIKDAVVAKKNSDENTFELDIDDIDEMFGNTMPDISSIFNFDKKTVRLNDVLSTM